MKLLILFLLVLRLSLISCDSHCNTVKKCGECIKNSECVWCEQENMEKEFHRCESKENINSSVPWCKKEFIIDPPLTMVTNDAEDWNVDGVKVQFRPLEIKIKVRPGVPVPFTVSYKPAEQYPLDVYFLIDNSDTMTNHKTALKKQAQDIYTKLMGYTNNVQFGIGTFVEKPAFPYFDARTGKKSNAFEHHLTFTKNIEEFRNAMDNLSSGANYDDPEAGFDALMQVMACDEKLGWRPASRRFVVLFTDSTYHSAGDGKMIGIIEPNDMKCHLKNNLYDKALEFDYPSVSQIRKVAHEGGFKIIFAVTSDVLSIYQALAQSIPSASYALLQSNIVELIVKEYVTAVNNAKLEAVVPSTIDLVIDQNCEKGSIVNCESTHDNPQVNISATLKVKSCQNPVEYVYISPSALSDKLKITVEIACECECEKKPIVGTSSVCNNGGALQCGICKCNPDRYGSECQCEGQSTVTIDNEKCKQNTNDTKYCNGNGECQCGTCECDKNEKKSKFYGDFCQFNDDYCPGSGWCSGNGKCKFNECQCYPGYKNTAVKKDCSCAVGDALCKAPYSKEVCSGYGVCECGKCICNKISEDKNDRYLGQYCDSSAEYTEKRCKELGDYAYCNYLHTQTFCDSQSSIVVSAEVVLVNKTDFDVAFDSGSAPTTCKKILEDGSYLLFKYYYEPKENYKLHMRIQNEPEYPPKANIYIAAGSAIGAVLLIGIATLIGWKILVDQHDKREFQKFANEAAAAGYNVENPLYQKPTNSFTNPAWTQNTT